MVVCDGGSQRANNDKRSHCDVGGLDDRPDRVGGQSASQQRSPVQRLQSESGHRDDEQRGREQGGEVGAIGIVGHRRGIDRRHDQASNDGDFDEHATDDGQKAAHLGQEFEHDGQQNDEQGQCPARQFGGGLDKHLQSIDESSHFIFRLDCARL